MSYSNHVKMLRQLKVKPPKVIKFKKHNVPKKRSCGMATKRCGLCGRIRGHIGSYGLHLCRQCFRHKALDLGFKKYN